MIFKTLEKSDAEKELKKYFERENDEIYYSNLDNTYKKIRNDLKMILPKYNKARVYQYDLDCAIKIYEYFNKLEGFNETVASNYNFWMYIAIKVIPDVAEARHGENITYYYDKNVRIYISTLWWYIHMSYQGSIEKTYITLKNLSTDYILNLVERPGRGLYLEVSRAIMKYIGLIDQKTRNSKVGDVILFRRLLIQNTSMINNYNLVFDDSVKEYVRALYLSCGVDINEFERD